MAVVEAAAAVVKQVQVVIATHHPYHPPTAQMVLVWVVINGVRLTLAVAEEELQAQVLVVRKVHMVALVEQALQHNLQTALKPNQAVVAVVAPTHKVVELEDLAVAVREDLAINKEMQETEVLTKAAAEDAAAVKAVNQMTQTLEDQVDQVT